MSLLARPAKTDSQPNAVDRFAQGEERRADRLLHRNEERTEGLVHGQMERLEHLADRVHDGRPLDRATLGAELRTLNFITAETQQGASILARTGFRAAERHPAQALQVRQAVLGAESRFAEGMSSLKHEAMAEFSLLGATRSSQLAEQRPERARHAEHARA